MRGGKPLGGRTMAHGQIHFILTNPIYVGQVRHKSQTYPGVHSPIVSEDLWHRVQTKLQANAARPRVRDKRTDKTLIRAIAKAHQWLGEARKGVPLAAIGRRYGWTDSPIRQRIRLAFCHRRSPPPYLKVASRLN